jgi:magnesium transporter
MLEILTRPEVEAALQQREFFRLRSLFADHEPAVIAEAIEQFEPEDRAVLFRLLHRDHAADTFEYLTPESQLGLIKALGGAQVTGILNDMAPDDRTAMLEELPASVTRQVLRLLSPEERGIARQLLGYPEDSIGRLMTPDFTAVQADWTVGQSLDHIRENGEDSETLNVIYVVDDHGVLIDDLRTRQLLLADPEARIGEICDGHFIALRAIDDQETAVDVFKEYDRVAFPVTDSRGVLLGIVTVDDVLDVAEEEATEDIQKIGGSAVLEHPFMQIAFSKMVHKRAGWLVLLFFGQLLTLEAMDLYSATIAQALVLVMFVPLIISSAGNSGTQAATLVVRAMALGEIDLGDWWKVLRREILFGIVLGLMLSTIGFVRVALDPRFDAFGHPWIRLGLAVGASLVCVVLWGVFLGSMLPFLMRRIGADPAATSAPFVATIADVTGLLIYFVIATSILQLN